MEKVFDFIPYFILVLSRFTAEGLAVKSCRLRRLVQPGLGCRDALVWGWLWAEYGIMLTGEL